MNRVNLVSASSASTTALPSLLLHPIHVARRVANERAGPRQLTAAEFALRKLFLHCSVYLCMNMHVCLSNICLHNMLCRKTEKISASNALFAHYSASSMPLAHVNQTPYTSETVKHCCSITTTTTTRSLTCRMSATSDESQARFLSLTHVSSAIASVQSFNL